MNPSPQKQISAVEQVVRERLAEAVDVTGSISRSIESILAAGRLIGKALAEGKLLITFGNGGSAADAQHIAAEFVGRFQQDRRGLPAIALNASDSTLTALANDFGYENVFARQVSAFADTAGVAVAISTSGRSANVVAGARAAKDSGLAVIALTGPDPTQLSPFTDAIISISSHNTARIQEGHAFVGHLLTEIAEQTYLERVGTALTKKHLSLEELLRARDLWRERGLTVVWTNGCFDLLHAGHVFSLRQAKALGNILVVGLNSDESTRAQKGPGRPFIPSEDRLQMMSELSSVDHVIVFDDATPISILEQLQPDIHCKGSEYAAADLPERDVVAEYGGKVVFLDRLDGRSTSSIIQRINEARLHDQTPG